MRENGGSLDFNFISLPNPMVDNENWVCRHHLQSTSSWKMMLPAVFWSIQTFYVGIFTEHFHFPPPTDRLWKIIFICSLYRLSATFKLLHHFGFVRSRLCCTHFLYRWHKIHNVLHHFMQICKRQCDPWLINSLVCWFHKSALDLVLFQISITSLYIGWLMVTIICSCGRLMVIVICSCGCLWVIVICSCGWLMVIIICSCGCLWVIVICSCGWLMVIIICSCGCLWVIVICSCGCLWVSVCCL